MRIFKCMAPEDEDNANSKYIDKEIKNWIKSYNDVGVLQTLLFVPFG